ncbi:hypothetical protein QCA50_011806 [Cerrena zonata]|uniref:Secreted protein n=1 Tax=Cerrena zonata TaxID=2478898 RepID=A0AAW0FVQ2_9APHY
MVHILAFISIYQVTVVCLYNIAIKCVLQLAPQHQICGVLENIAYRACLLIWVVSLGECVKRRSTGATAPP